MARRVSLPAADDLFRRTAQGEAADDGARRSGEPSYDAPAQPAHGPFVDGGPGPADRDGAAPRRGRRPSGRVRHDEKMTIYVTASELLEIEHARLALRSMHGLAVDRGRLVREAIAMALADLDTNGDDSLLVQRLTGR